ncbi:hypothetical protein DICPUDRAFT_98705 [Dictyostelium purpureum]|uniref:Uncharacterized protein n=1 Tax=Dictyostelium purpureum TaxID=5786 RepID=F0ZSU2_DICPU|nr:uncharacterized protein DICPUDRAFT_98705 [Dictyostelium purpureum]EGC32967.1 hypothetical protein DICPUDRAFT_98705 [Dictyostelium purpureum]|eukprot:XP_003290485.1 hypothetical protein DICPUDRAFT_98705 [Dictyostelium purpureum]
MFSKNSQNVTVKSSIQKKYQNETGVKYRFDRNQYAESILLPQITYNNNCNNEKYFKDIIKKEIKPILLSLSFLIKNYKEKQQQQPDDQLILYSEINSLNNLTKKCSELFNNLINQYNNEYLIIKSMFKYIVCKSLFKKTTLYNKDSFSKLKPHSNINFPSDWSSIEFKQNSDYHFILPLNCFLYFIEKLDLSNNFTELLIINYKSDSNNNNHDNNSTLILVNPFDQFIKSIKIKTSTNGINIGLMNTLFSLIFTNNNNSEIINNINNKVIILEFFIDSILNDGIDIIKSTPNIKSFQFQFTISYLNTLVELSDITISTPNPTITDKLIFFLESFYNIIFIKWEKKIFELYPLKLFHSRLFKLHTILNNNKFQNGLIGILNFSLYSLVNKDQNNNTDNNTDNNYQIEEINTETKDINNNFKIFNYYNFLHYFNNNDSNKDIYYLYGKILIILRRYLDNLQKDISLENLKQIKQPLNLIISIPFHLNKIKLLNNQIENYFMIWFQELLPIAIKVFDSNYTISTSSSTSSTLFLEEIKNLIYIMIYISKFYKTKLNLLNYNQVSTYLVHWFLSSSLPNLSTQFLRDLNHQIVDIGSDIIQQIKETDKSSSPQSIQSLLNKSLNQLTLNINQQQHAQAQENEETNEQKPTQEEPITADSTENELKILENLKLISFLDLPLLLNRVLKSILKNKGQSKFFIELLFNKLYISTESIFDSILELFLPNNEMVGGATLFSNDSTIFNFKSFFNFILNHIDNNNINSNNSIDNNIIIYSYLNYLKNLNIIFVKFITPFLKTFKKNSDEPNQLHLFFEILTIYLNQLSNIHPTTLNNNPINNEVNNQKLLLRDFFLDFLETINYQFINNKHTQNSPIFLELFYNLIENLINYLNNNNNNNIIDLETILKNIKFFNLDWKLQFRIYNLLNSSIDNDNNLFSNLSLNKLLSLESIWDNNDSNSINNKVIELFQISNLFEICFVSENYLNQIIKSLLVNNDKSNNILFTKNKYKFKKLILIYLVNKLPNSPSYYYKYLINNILPVLIKNNLIDTQIEPKENDSQEKSMFLYQLLKNFLKFNSFTINQDQELNSIIQIIYFLKQISILYQDLFINDNESKNFGQEELLYNLKIILKSIKILLTFNYFKQFELFFIISLSLINIYENKKEENKEKTKILMENCRNTLTRALNLLKDKKLENEDNQIINDKLNTLLNKLK